ncbi:MAG: GMC family oxidoreductase, partial [Alphaproteobacteria bacterium]|nr:GMC family oxidoreductase [Alphaproteobacteria bacterium]
MGRTSKTLDPVLLAITNCARTLPSAQTRRGCSVINAGGRTWDIFNLWICDASLFPAGAGVNPRVVIQALACRIGDRIAAMAKCAKVGGRHE